MKTASPSAKTAVVALLSVALPAAGIGLVAQENKKPASNELFETKVRPVLVEKCFSCHSEGASALKGGLKMDSRVSLLKGGNRGAAITPGDPEHSLLVTAIGHEDKNLKMPPTGKLTNADIAAITAWVKMGAPWPAERESVSPKKPSTRFWAYLAPKQTPTPINRLKGWAKSSIDQYILAGLERKGLKPAPVADRRTLIRRATFDLIGLPPTPQEVADFLNDKSPDAFARVIDRLLASTAYGERWGRHWLDVVRYADSNGVDENLVYANAWRYRDYVVRALNQDKPVDRFIHEQIAGDLLPEVADESANHDRIIATGYLSLGPKMLAEDDPIKQEEDIIDEQIDTLGKTFMGITLGCARCHDHKFDPFPQTDYYSLAGIFKSTRTMMNFKNMAEWQEVPLAPRDLVQKQEAIEKLLKEKRKKLEEVRNKASEVLVKQAKANSAGYREAAKVVLAGLPNPSTLKPIASDKSALPGGALLIEAEEFVRGNVLKDRGGFGKDIGVLVNAGQYPNETEYEVVVKEAGPYQLDLRYASGDPRPIHLQINGVTVSANAAGKVTGGFNPDKQAWFAEGVFRLKAGKNMIRFERASYFPHIDKFLLVHRPGAPITQTLEQLASEAGLIPDFLRQTVDVLKADPKSELEFEAPDNVDSIFPAPVFAEIKQIKEEIQAQQKVLPKLPRAMAVSEAAPTNMKVRLRGNYLTLGQECRRQFPEVLAGSNQPEIAPTSSGRLELANWLTSPGHPLTARVFVNRVWRWHFGTGLVGSADNFGTLGDRPVNKALLDHLSLSFIQDGWSLKRLHKRIMLSSVYLMSSKFDAKAAAIDPENKLQWRASRRRLEAEAIRDSILAVSEQLDRTIGGSLLKFGDRQYVTSTANSDPVNYNSKRRSLYLPVIRSALYDVYTAFDFGDPTVMNGDRPTTTVAPQALFMMNSQIVLEQSKEMANRLLTKQEMDDEARVRVAYETCYARPATSSEVARSLQFLRKLESAYAEKNPTAIDHRLRAWQSLCKTLMAANEFIYID